MASTVPNLIAYDPAFAYEIAVIVEEGLRRMVRETQDVFYYVTLQNENYLQLPMPGDVKEGILRGIYKFRDAPARLAHSASDRVGARTSGLLSGVRASISASARQPGASA